MKSRASNPFRLQLFTLSVLLAAPSAHAADGTWLGTSGNWTDTGTWTGGTIANGADFTANFTGVDIAADQTITLNGNRSIGNIIFTDDTTSSNNLTITGNTLTLDRTDAVAPIIDVTQANRQLSISSIIAGNDGLQKNGAGTLRLTSANTFTGGLTINAGTVFLNAASNVNALSSGKVTIGDVANSGASAELLYSGTNGNNSFSNLIDVRGNGTATIRVIGYNPTFSGAINLGNNLNVVSNNSFGSTIGISGGITGTGNLVIQSNAANTASSAITFSGTTLNFNGSITNSGTTTSTTASHTTISAVIGTNVTGITQNSTNSQLILTGNNTFTSNILISAGTLQANRVSSGAAPTSGALGNTQALGRTATISSGGTLRFGTNDVMGDGGSAPKLTLIANGGTILNGGNFINSLGPVQLNGGTLNSSGTGTGFKLTGTVTVSGSAVSTVSANASGNIASNSTITYDVADAVAGSGSDLNVTAVLADIFGAGGIIKTGVGTMTLSNQNTYIGGTRIDNGILALGHATNTLANTGAVNVNGGTLALGTNADTVGAVTLTSGSITGSGAGTLTGTGSAYDVHSGSVSAKLGGSVGLTKTTAGTVTLSGVNAYSGATAVNGGRLTIDTGGSIHTSSGVTIAGGALRYNASTNLATTVTFTSGTLEGTNWNGNLSGLTIGSGQTISPGNSPGTATTDSQTWAGLGSYLFEINNATGGAGADPGWDLLSGSGSLNIAATSVSTFNILLTSLGLGNIAGDAANFSDATGYNWLFADFVNPITGYAAERFFVNTTAFDNAFTGTFGVALGNTVGGGDNTQLYLTYTPIPEPRPALLGGLGLLALLRRRRD